MTRFHKAVGILCGAALLTLALPGSAAMARACSASYPMFGLIGQVYAFTMKGSDGPLGCAIGP
jgi:hypothetical protein